MNLLRRINWEYVLVALGLGVLSLVFLGDYLIPPSGQFLGGSDMVGQLAQGLRLVVAELHAGRLPLWNPYLASGLPLWANPQLGLLYPPNWILLVLRWEVGISLITAFHLFWIGLGMYVWARGHDLSIGGAVVGALILAYNGLMTVRGAEGHPDFIGALAWLPWVMTTLDCSFRTRTLKSALLIGVPLAFCILAGNPAAGMLVALLATVWTVAEMLVPRQPSATWRERLWLPVRQLALGGGVAIGLAAAQLFPTAELLYHSVRNNQSYEFASQYSLPLAHLISFIIPNFFGEPVRLGYWGEPLHIEYMLYPGLLALLLAGVAMRYGHEQRPVRLWIVLALVGLLLALGPAGGLHPLLYSVFPPIRLVRSPARFGFYAVFALASLAAWAVDYLQSHPERRLGSITRWAWAAGLPGALSIVAYLVYILRPQEDARAYHIGSGLLEASLFAGLSGALLLWRPRLSSRAFAGLAALLVIADLWGYGVRQLHFTTVPQDLMWTQTAALVQKDSLAPVRVLPWGIKLLQQNLGMDVNLASTSAYDPLLLSDYQAFVESVPDPRATTFDLLNAEYLLIGADQPEWRNEPSLQFVGQAGDFALYRRLAALPRAWIVPALQVIPKLPDTLAAIHAPGFNAREIAFVPTEAHCPTGTGGEAKITRYQPSRLTLMTNGSGLLVLSETWYPGWQASVDGQPVPILKADGVLRGVCVLAGPHMVEFRFDPPLVKWGFVTTGVTIILLATLFVYPHRTPKETKP